MRRRQPKKTAVDSDRTSSPSFYQRQKDSNVSKKPSIKPRSNSVIEAPRGMPAAVSGHGMTLRKGRKQDSVHNPATHVSSSEITSRPSRASTSTLPAFSTIEPVVRASSHMPHGYTFVPKGNPYVTRNCRQQTQRARQVVYAVVDDGKKQIGIRVPQSVYAAVVQSEGATRLDRERNVRKHDEALKKRFSDAILAEFPRIPFKEVPKIVHRAMVKRAGRVGRTGRKEMAEKAQLAVQAHIRHTKTDYDSLLRSGTGRGKARNLTLRKALDVQREWGPEHPGNRKLRTISRQISRKPTQTLKKKMAPIKRATAQKDTARSANPRAKKTSVASRGRPAEEGKAKDPRVTRSIARTKLKKQQRRKRRQAKRSSAALKTAV